MTDDALRGRGHREAYALLAPLASEDERDLAARMLEPVPPLPPAVTPEGWRRVLGDMTVGLSSLLGDDEPAKRWDRVLRSAHRK